MGIPGVVQMEVFPTTLFFCFPSSHSREGKFRRIHWLLQPNRSISDQYIEIIIAVVKLQGAPSSLGYNMSKGRNERASIVGSLFAQHFIRIQPVAELDHEHVVRRGIKSFPTSWVKSDWPDGSAF